MNFLAIEGLKILFDDNRHGSWEILLERFLTFLTGSKNRSQKIERWGNSKFLTCRDFFIEQSSHSNPFLLFRCTVLARTVSFMLLLSNATVDWASYSFKNILCFHTNLKSSILIRKIKEVSLSYLSTFERDNLFKLKSRITKIGKTAQTVRC
jgi:hypothetical protein